MEIDLVAKKEKSASTYSLEKDYLVHACSFMSQSYQNYFILTVFKTQSSQVSGCLGGGGEDMHWEVPQVKLLRCRVRVFFDFDGGYTDVFIL